MTKFSKKKIKQMNNFNKLFCTACLNYFLRIERNENQKIDEFYFLNKSYPAYIWDMDLIHKKDLIKDIEIIVSDCKNCLDSRTFLENKYKDLSIILEILKKLI